jgi:hypothetical protein
MWEQELRAAWVLMRNEADALGVASKDSQGVLGALFGHYRRLTQGERSVIDRLLAEQLRSDDEGLRFDAMALIREFRIVSALDDLCALALRLETAHGPGGPYKWAEADRLIGQLSTSAEI